MTEDSKDQISVTAKRKDGFIDLTVKKSEGLQRRVGTTKLDMRKEKRGFIQRVIKSLGFYVATEVEGTPDYDKVAGLVNEDIKKSAEKR